MNEEAMIYFWKSTDGNSVYFNTDPEEAKKDGYTTKPKTSCTLEVDDPPKIAGRYTQDS